MSAYDSGNFQGGNNKYTRALKVLRNLEEYNKFDWRNNWEEYQKNKQNLKEEYNNLLIKAFKTKLPKDKFIIKKDYFGKNVYMKFRKNSRVCNWSYEKEKATKFNYKQEAENVSKCFTNNENFKIELYA